ncbi:NAD(P)-dependent oxidoreductase, partial [Mycobacterium sp. ITM-2017-0098]
MASKGTLDLSGKVAFITGGASGIGAALASKLVSAGERVWIADRQFQAAEKLAHQLGASAHAVELDVRDPAAFDEAISR